MEKKAQVVGKGARLEEKSARLGEKGARLEEKSARLREKSARLLNKNAPPREKNTFMKISFNKNKAKTFELAFSPCLAIIWRNSL